MSLVHSVSLNGHAPYAYMRDVANRALFISGQNRGPDPLDCLAVGFAKHQPALIRRAFR